MRPRRSQSGFVLALTLWVLAAVVIAASFFSAKVTRLRELALRAQEASRAEIALAGARAEVLFRLGTMPMSVYGLGADPASAVALDNRAYRGPGGSIVRLQDDRGLLNLNIVSADRLYRFLGALGIPGDERGRMIDTLNDYIDADSFKRLNGAEAPDYLARGLPPPRNEALVTPLEAERIIGWRDVPALWDNGLLASLTTTSQSVALNPNTAPWQVLATLPGITDTAAQRIVTLRAAAPLTTLDQLAALAGIPTQWLVMQVISFPSNAVRVSLSAPRLPWSVQYNVTLTPMSDDAPWRIDYYYRTKLAAPDDQSNGAPRLPPRSALPASAAAPLLSTP